MCTGLSVTMLHALRSTARIGSSTRRKCPTCLFRAWFRCMCALNCVHVRWGAEIQRKIIVHQRIQTSESCFWKVWTLLIDWSSSICFVPEPCDGRDDVTLMWPWGPELWGREGPNYEAVRARTMRPWGPELQGRENPNHMACSHVVLVGLWTRSIRQSIHQSVQAQNIFHDFVVHRGCGEVWLFFSSDVVGGRRNHVWA